MSVTKQKINTLGPVNVYGVQVTADSGVVSGAEEWPARADLEEDRMYRAITGMDIQWAKSGGSDGIWAVQIGARNASFYTPIWQRWMSALDSTGTDAALQGSETRSQASYYRAPKNNISIDLPLLLPPGLGFRVLPGGNGFFICDLRIQVAEAPDPGHLWPYLSEERGGIAGT